MVDRSIVKPKQIIKDLLITIDLCEYPIDFVVLQLKTNLGGYPLILGQPLLATAGAFIGCKLGNMTISKGDIIKKLVRYPPDQPHSDLEEPIWPTLEEEEKYSL